jgi:hypothetical protein
MLVRFLAIALVSFFLVGCYGGESDDSSNGNSNKEKPNDDDDPTVYSVSFYNSLLDRNATIEVASNANDLNLAQLKAQLDINASALYAVSSDMDVANETAYAVTGDANFYAIANVTEITDQAGLAAINANMTTLSGAYILLNDIALDENDAGFDAEGWNPIGRSQSIGSRFEGLFNGDGHKITGLWIDRPTTDYIGLFGYISGAQIRNLGVEISDRGITGNDYVGAITGIVYGAITNSYARGNVSGNSEVGAIAGRVSGAITNSYAAGDVNATGDYVGGIAGLLYSSSITYSYAAGDVNATGSNVGGIAGLLYGGSITNSYARGNVSGNSKVGGIAGYINYGSWIVCSYATGSVSGTYNVGGIAGEVYNSTVHHNAAINQSVKRIPEKNGNYYVGRVVGAIQNSAQTSNNFARSALNSGFNNFVDSNAYSGAGKLDDDFREQATYESARNGNGLGGLGWSFGNDEVHPWKIDSSENDGYPYLYWENRSF